MQIQARQSQHLVINLNVTIERSGKHRQTIYSICKANGHSSKCRAIILNLTTYFIAKLIIYS